MTALNDVDRVLAGRLVEVLRDDPDLMTLLFSQRASVHQHDRRVYVAWSELPPLIAEVLPRIIVAVQEFAFDTEQDSADGSTPYADCAIYVHVVSENDQVELGRAIAARAREVLVSTPLSDARIIVSKLWSVGHRVDREREFRDAYRFTREFRAQAGVLS